jgi:hypothetical protein
MDTNTRAAEVEQRFAALSGELRELLPAYFARLAELQARGLSESEIALLLRADPQLGQLIQALQDASASATPAANEAQGGVALSGSFGDTDINTLVGRDNFSFTFNMAAPDLPSPQKAFDAADALSMLKRSATGRETIGRYQEVIDASFRGVALLSSYKLLHDQLHRLEFTDLRNLQTNLHYFPDEVARESVADFHYQLDQTIQRLSEIAAQAALPAGEMEDNATLQFVATQIASAVASSQKSELEAAVKRLRRVLGKWPNRINTQMVVIARGLRLEQPVLVMRRLRDDLATRERNQRLLDEFAAFMEAAAASRLLAGLLGQIQLWVDDLDRFRQQLDTLVAEHDSWQRIDDDFRMIEFTLALDTAQLNDDWPQLRRQLADLCLGSTSAPNSDWAQLVQQLDRVNAPERQWVSAIRSELFKLDRSIAEQRDADLRRAFMRLYREIGQRFFDVDTNLKNFCGELRNSSNPFSRIAVLFA